MHPDAMCGVEDGSTGALPGSEREARGKFEGRLGHSGGGAVELGREGEKVRRLEGEKVDEVDCG